MNSNERRMSPRKTFVAPVRFRFLREEVATAVDGRETRFGHALEMRAKLASLEQFEGETLNISERGVGFVTNEQMEVGEPLEMRFTLPRELTGRSTEDVRCNSRVVHVDPGPAQGTYRIGAYVENYKPVYYGQVWDN